MRVHETLLEVWEITQRKGGAIYKTRYLRDEWVPLIERSNAPPDNPDHIHVSANDATCKRNNVTMPYRTVIKG